VTGKALDEARYINKSLFTLANIVKAKEKGIKPNMNVRDSKLTMLL
jgi:hypothetical protein